MTGAATDPIMLRCRALFEVSRMSLEELGLKMGYKDMTARKSAWQFLRQANAPRVSMLRKFARAVGLSSRELVEG
jgi:hypothetical protein